MVSFRLGGRDGVSIEAAKWQWALETLGWDVGTVAGEGTADVILPGLAIDAIEPPTDTDLKDALADADLVVVENLCSLPLNPPALEAVAAALHGRPALLHHHDLPWQRERFAAWDRPVPTDPAWLHVTINDLSRGQLGERGIATTTIRNAFDTDEPAGARDTTRRTLGIADDELLVLQPTRAIARKGIPAAVALAGELGATYWLLGPAEEGYGDELAAILDAAPVRVLREGDFSARDAYAASDVVAFPSLWEGFGNPTIESAVHRRPLAVSRYPVAREIERFGFQWFDPADPAPLRRWLERRDNELLDHNAAVARRVFSLPTLVERLGHVLERGLWKTSL